MVRISTFVLLSALALGASGCAATVFKPRVEAVGEYRNTEPISDRATDMEDDSASDVKVLVGQLLPGMTYKDGLLSVDQEMYEVLGKVSAEPSHRFFYPYKETWRRPVCWPQIPLVYATLFVWTVVPTSWGCFVHDGSPDERKESIVGAMRRATKALGGNLVLVGGFGGTVVINVNTGAELSATEATHGVGWALRVKRAPESKPTPAGVQL
jgi:hypothetical protein